MVNIIFKFFKHMDEQNEVVNTNPETQATPTEAESTTSTNEVPEQSTTSTQSGELPDEYKAAGDAEYSGTSEMGKDVGRGYDPEKTN